MPHPDLPPAIVVRRLRDAAHALGGGAPVTLLSAPGAAAFAGPPHWRALMDAARDATPGAVFVDLLDCGDAPGRALEALRLGLRRLVLDADPVVAASVAARAAACGGFVLPARPLALDLGAAPDDARARAMVASWLARGSAGAGHDGEGGSVGPFRADERGCSA